MENEPNPAKLRNLIAVLRAHFSKPGSYEEEAWTVHLEETAKLMFVVARLGAAVVNEKVYGVWSEEDYYGPHLIEMCVTREVAEQVQAVLNTPYQDQCRANGVTDIPQDWPHTIQEHMLTFP